MRYILSAKVVGAIVVYLVVGICLNLFVATTGFGKSEKASFLEDLLFSPFYPIWFKLAVVLLWPLWILLNVFIGYYE